MENKPFWETAYSDLKVSAFSKGPTADVEDHFRIFPSNAAVLDVGCGEGRNSVFMAKLGNRVDAFDISAAGIEKARQIAEMEKVSIRFLSVTWLILFSKSPMTSSFAGNFFTIQKVHSVTHIRAEFIMNTPMKESLPGSRDEVI